MILVLWLARLLDWLTLHTGRAANAVYRVHFRLETRKAKREAEQRAIESRRHADPPRPIGSPHRKNGR